MPGPYPGLVERGGGRKPILSSFPFPFSFSIGRFHIFPPFLSATFVSVYFFISLRGRGQLCYKRITNSKLTRRDICYDSQFCTSCVIFYGRGLYMAFYSLQHSSEYRMSVKLMPKLNNCVLEIKEPVVYPGSK